MNDDASLYLCGSNNENSAGYETLLNTGVCSGQELNLKPQSVENKELSGTIKGERVQNPVHNLQICPELQQIITVWPNLSEQQRKSILDIARKESLSKKQVE